MNAGFSLFPRFLGLLPAGLDLKSLLLNLASTLLFVLPFALFFYFEFAQEMVIVLAAVFGLALLAPPMGWRRPHPYSDDPTNVPMGTKRE